MDKIFRSILADGDAMEIDVPNIKQDYQISFCGRITKMGLIALGHGFTQPWTSAYVEVDNKSIRVYTFKQDRELLADVAHGLTVQDFISINIRVKCDATADILLTTISGEFQQNIVWNGGFGPVKAILRDGELSDCNLQFYGEAFHKPIWGFGDSYFDHWPLLLNNKGKSNWLVDGGSGRGSLGAMASLEKALKYNIPKCIFWCMGMNDADSSDGINENWKSVAEKLIHICNQYQIELILTTVPNVPARCHTYKNEYVRKSGYRYVDLEQALEADKDPKWYPGLQEADEVHPTVMGAKVIAARVLADIPELLKID